MKTASFIIAHILTKPEFANVKCAGELDRFLKVALGKATHSLVKFAYKKHKTIFIAAAHSAHLQELRHDSNTKLIKSYLKNPAFMRHAPSLKEVENVVFFLSKMPNAAQPLSQIYPPLKAKLPVLDCKFENRAQNEAVRACVESLREALRAAKESVEGGGQGGKAGEFFNGGKGGR